MKLLSSLVFALLLILVCFVPGGVMAEEKAAGCGNRFTTLVNPVRSRHLWGDKSLNPLKDQYGLVKQYNLPATWLLQYDVLSDRELLDEIRKFDQNQEKGILLEVSQKHAEDARVIYSRDVPWFSPQAVFLSGYSQSDRRRLIDKLFENFKINFGYYPKSVGVWWIDSYSLNYLKEKYNISSALIVADQKTTDNYGVWGQWWGLPYYPAKANILTPASSLNNKLEVVIIQWAQRDPMLAIGEGPKYSNYSLQANDYLERGKNTEYFNQLVDVYLNCQNPIGQVTVGLETGIESVNHLGEYNNQLESLKQRIDLNFVTMSDFAKQFRQIYPDYPKQMKISVQNSNWNLTTDKRSNSDLKEIINYNQEISFADYFIKDTNKFLDRSLTSQNKQKSLILFPWFLIISLIPGVISYQKRMFRVWITSMLFALGAFGLILRSYYQMGWQIYFGPKLPYLELFQMLLVLVIFLLFWFINRWKLVSKNLLVLPFLFGFNFLIQAVRISYFSDRYYVGFAADALRFIGVSIKPVSDIKLINQDFPSFISAAFLRIDFEHLWEKPILALFLYPLVYIAGGILLGVLLNKLSKRVHIIMMGILVILFMLYLNSMMKADPRQVVPILLQ